MVRIRIELPAQFPFATEIPVLIGHINYGNHLDNAQVLGLVSEARLRYLKSLGYSELDVAGRGIIARDAAVQYRSEAFHGEVMVVEMGVADFHDYGCDFIWRLTARASGREVARGKTGIVFFDYQARKKAKVPEAFRQLFPEA